MGLGPLLGEDPQIIGALGAALLARERYDRTGTTVGLKVNYGYSDGSGDYFITIDTDRCDGCGECVSACPSAIFEMIKDDSGQLKAVVIESARKKLAFLCLGFHSCERNQRVNCHSVCQKEAISHTW